MSANARTGSLCWLLIVVAPLTACSQQPSNKYGTGNRQHEALVNSAVQQMMQPSPSSKRQGWPAQGQPEESLAALAQHIQNLFNRREEIDKLIFPEGWVRRRWEPQQVAHRVQQVDDRTRGMIELTYQKKSSVIHPTRQQAAEDDDLLPYPSAQTREQMTSKLRRPWPPVKLTIQYELVDDSGEKRWRRIDWSAEPEITEGDDFLDRLGVP
jgi:hypothetical protein